MKTIEKRDYLREESTVPDKEAFSLFEYFNQLSSITTESLYVLDIVQRQFCYVKPDDLFLCGFSVEDAMKQGYGFYAKIIYPEDLSLWTDMCKIILRYLKDSREERDEIDYFSCMCRLQCNYSFLTRPLSRMIFHRMKPVWVSDVLRYLICTVESSTVKDVGDLCIYNKDGLTYKAYNFKSKRKVKRSRK